MHSAMQIFSIKTQFIQKDIGVKGIGCDILEYVQWWDEGHFPNLVETHWEIKIKIDF